MRRIVLLLVVNVLLAFLLLREAGPVEKKPTLGVVNVEKICLPGGAELTRRGDSWWFVRPFFWPAVALPPKWTCPSRQGPVVSVAEGRWQDFLDRRLVWHGHGLLDRIQLRLGDVVTLLERRNGEWQALPRGDLDRERMQRWLKSLRTLEVEEPVAGSGPVAAGNAVAVLLLEGPLVTQRQRLEFFRREDGSGLVRVNGKPLFSLTSENWEEILRDMTSLRSHLVFPPAERARVVWEDKDGVILWERDGERWLRIPGTGALEEVPAAAIEELLQKLHQLEWQEELTAMKSTGEVALSVDGERLRLGQAKDGMIVAWKGERCFTLDAAVVEELRRLLRRDDSTTTTPPDENGQD